MTRSEMAAWLDTIPGWMRVCAVLGGVWLVGWSNHALVGKHASIPEKVEALEVWKRDTVSSELRALRRDVAEVKQGMRLMVCIARAERDMQSAQDCLHVNGGSP